jgi:hypothetical protein
MTDFTQPATAAEFEAVGVDATTAVGLAAQHNLMSGRAGSFDDRIALAHQLENLPPPAKPTAVPSMVTPAEATAMLEAHTEAEVGAHLATVMLPPASPADYKFPLTSLAEPTDEQIAADSELKSALHAEQMPKFAVESIGKSLAEASRMLANETPAQAQTRLGSNKARLTALWGGDFDGSIKIVDAFLEQIGTRSPALREFIDRVAPVLDPLSIDLLLQVAKNRAGKR